MSALLVLAAQAATPTIEQRLRHIVAVVNQQRPNNGHARITGAQTDGKNLTLWMDVKKKSYTPSSARAEIAKEACATPAMRDALERGHVTLTVFAKFKGSDRPARFDFDGTACGATRNPVVHPTVAEHAAPKDVYGFRNSWLGMDLPQYRAQRFPDSGWPNAKPVCSSDSNVATGHILHTDQMRSAGVVTCMYMDAMLAAVGVSGLRPVPISLGNNAGAWDATYSFYQGKLYRIGFSTRDSASAGIVAGLTAKYGQPEQSQRSTVQNRLGASFERVTTFWSKGTQRIEVATPGDRLDTVKVEIFDIDLSALVARNGIAPVRM